jgi:hypothetical protein
MFNKKKLAIIVLLAASIGSACNRGPELPDDPKGRLKDYISKSFNIKNTSDRQALVAFLTGDAKIRLSAWSDDQFREAFVESKRQFQRLAFREAKTISASEVNITYDLTYVDQSRGADAKVTNRKLARMVKEQGKWMIADVKNIKELVEYSNEMSLP